MKNRQQRLDDTQLKNDYEQVLQKLQKMGYQIQAIPKDLRSDNTQGESLAIAYPIQGLLKYHGMADKVIKTSNFSSISLNNSSALTITYLKLSDELEENRIIFNGVEQPSSSRIVQRIENQLNQISVMTGNYRKALIITRNISTEKLKTWKSDQSPDELIIQGKGLGTSAAGGAAIAHNLVNILYKDRPEHLNNPQLRSLFARFLAGSASRSAVGGIGIWLNYPTIPSEKSLALRLDTTDFSAFINDLALITVSIESPFKTEIAHSFAKHSPFYESWAYDRNEQIMQFLKALEFHDIQGIGELSEMDTLKLHSVTMTSTLAKDLILWTPETIKVMHIVRGLRSEGIPAYFSIDTGPSVVIITLAQHKDEIMEVLQQRLNGEKIEEISCGTIADGSQIISESSEYYQILKSDIEKFQQ